MNQLVFYKNWWDLAQLQTDGDLRLAFYDAIFDYAFEGKVPTEVGRDGAKTDRAARFAYLTVQPVIDLSVKRAAAGAASGASRRDANTPTNKTRTKREHADEQNANTTANTTANKTRTKREHADEHDSAKKTNTTANNRIEKNRIEENRIETTTGRGGCGLPSREVFLSTCESALGVPRDFADAVYTELSMFDGEDAAGERIGSWRRYVKAAWNREQSARAAASVPSDAAPRRITEDDL